jgi:hypothetical protein
MTSKDMQSLKDTELRIGEILRYSRPASATPDACTEQGVAMLSSVLRSKPESQSSL